MPVLPLLSFDEAHTVGVKAHDHWLRMTGAAPVPRGDSAWADLVQFVTKVACERVVEREVTEDDVPW
jgi:hypothetical protein